MLFNVEIPEVHYLNLEIEADTEQDALEKAKFEYNNGGLPGILDLEYSHTLPVKDWKVSLQ